MNFVYLDIETYFKEKTPNFKKDKIISIQTKSLIPFEQELHIYSTWKKDNIKQKFKEILEQKYTCFVGHNLNFEYEFYKTQIDPTFSSRNIFSLDVQPILIFMNDLKFKNHQWILGKMNFSKTIPELYERKKFALIEYYTKDECEKVTKLFFFLKPALNALKTQFFTTI